MEQARQRLWGLIHRKPGEVLKVGAKEVERLAKRFRDRLFI